ncbi:hypothetical protein EBB07_21755 [Paenibacillaceae bacterium]|nr:hypothetical protein EBB07_21755 [Paenibacillaceae bacterium]
MPTNYIIVYPQHATAQERLAAHEIRRYVYLRTSQLLPLLSSNELPEGMSGFAVSQEGAGQSYRIYTVTTPQNHTWVHVTGGDEGGILYAAYRVAEQLGVRFALHGDIIPDSQIPLSLAFAEEHGKPLFELRGILPFHDFPEGPDWWSVDDYKSVIAQLPKLRMNFFGLHTYPEKEPNPLSYNAEPAVWIGLPEDAGSCVKASYPSRHFTTESEVWGYAPKATSSFSDGAGELFDRDDYGAPHMEGMAPWPADEQAENKLFDQFGELLGDIFSFAKQLGAQSCVGTELPLTIPARLRQRLTAAGIDPDKPETVQRLYEGIFKRIQHVHPLDYYWLWTPEEWTWNGNTKEQSQVILQDIQAAVAAVDTTASPFKLATCGWVLGPQEDRTLYDRVLPDTMPFSCINRQFGFEFVDDGFQAVQQRPTWAIPWMEDDPALILPQLWAGRMRRDAADAAAYGCNGLLGIHWRTRIIEPNVAALAAAGWEQSGWNPHTDYPASADADHEDPRAEGAIGGQSITFPAVAEDDAPEGTAAAYVTGRIGSEGYRMHIPGGYYDVSLTLREAAGNNGPASIMNVSVYGQSEGQAISRIVDLAEQADHRGSYTLTFKNIQVIDGLLGVMLRPLRGEAALCAVEVAGQPYGYDPEQENVFSRKINCGGSAHGQYEADLPVITVRQRHLPVEDFYLDWATTRFGPEAGADIAEVFSALDGNLPRPVVWVTGPGSDIAPNRSSWQIVSNGYAFVDRLEALRERVAGKGNLERLDYWLHQFRYLRCAARIGCELGSYEAIAEKIGSRTSPDEQKALAIAELLPLRISLAASISELNRHLLAAVSTPGELGTVSNVQQQAMHKLLQRSGQQLAQWLGEPLPPEATPSAYYTGEPRMIVPTVRTLLSQGEELRLTILFLGVQPDDAAVYWSVLGGIEYNRIPLQHVSRGVYSTVIPGSDEDLEYYVADPGSGLQFPATAGTINQTIVRMQA